MNRADVTELHYITAIANVPSILQHGILSHTVAELLAHDSVAMPEIQERRRNKQIPGAGRLHDYANLYFDAHNPMLSRCRDRNSEICVMRIDPVVLDHPGVIVTDRNAASAYVGFFPVMRGLAVIERERVYAQFWTHRDDPYDEMSHKSEKCAEVLVPDRADARFILGAYVANRAALEKVSATKFSIARDCSQWYVLLSAHEDPHRRHSTIKSSDSHQHGELCRRYGQGHCPGIQETIPQNV